MSPKIPLVEQKKKDSLQSHYSIKVTPPVTVIKLPVRLLRRRGFPHTTSSTIINHHLPPTSPTNRQHNYSSMKTTHSTLICAILSSFGTIHEVHGFAPSNIKILSTQTLTATPATALFSYDNNSKNAFSVPDIDLSSLGDALSNFNFDRVAANVKGNGEPLGSRGEYYFVAQAILIFCIVIGGIPYAGPAFQFM
jgi:hypothetical protein